MARSTILLIEDDSEIRELIAISFAREGWIMEAAADGEKGLALLAATRPDCVVLDIMLPGMDGLEVLRRMKGDRVTRKIPVIMTTARGEDSDVVAGLELGADDYVVKPFSPKVLAARVRAALRRVRESGENTGLPDTPIVRGRLVLDPVRHEATFASRKMDLSATEFAILELLMSSPGRVFSRGGIIEAVKGPDYPVTDRSVDVQILQLRKKLGEGGDVVETVRGVGYRFKDEA
jgi:two-component system phosphate regulon response regulator PhoB